MVKSYAHPKTVYYKEVFFESSDSFQSWTVPVGVTKIHATVVAAKGLRNNNVYADTLPGYGGKVECDLIVTPLQTLYLVAAKVPTSYSTASYNASDIRTDNTGITNTASLQSRLIVAGGGGSNLAGRPSNYGGIGGNGGGLTGANGSSSSGQTVGGYGGTQSGGGSGGYGRNGSGAPGTLGLGGNGGAGGGGAGGAGYYGGGGGASGYSGSTGWYGGGAGGSSYTDANLCTNVVHTQGFNSDGDGYIKIKYVSDETDYTEAVIEGTEYKGVYDTNEGYMLWKASTGVYENTNYVTLTINPTPNDATVILESEYSSRVGNTITVLQGSEVSYTVSKEGYGTESHTIIVNSTQTLNVTMSENCTFAINPTPSDATVVLTATGYTQVGNTITVPCGTTVSFNVSKNGYETINDSLLITESQVLNPTLREYVTLTINPTPNDATVVLTATGYTQVGNSITVLEGDSVTYTVSRADYQSSTGTVVVSSDTIVSVTLEEAEALWYCYVANETSSYPYIWYFSTKPVTPSGVLKDYYYKSHYRYATSSSQLNETHNYSGMHDITDDSFIDGQGDVFYYKPEYNLYT